MYFFYFLNSVFLLTLTSCVSFSPAVFEFELTSCPKNGFELPKSIEANNWKIEPSAKQKINCLGSKAYTFREQSTSITRGVRGSNEIHARIVLDQTCKLKVGLPSPDLCGNQPIESCKAFSETREIAENFSKTITYGQSFSIKTPAIKQELLTNEIAYEKWCEEK